MVLALFNRQEKSEVRLEVPVPDFIPYACHYGSHTILTKNGELLQIIKIVGFSYEAVGAKQVDLRETVRKAILNNIKNNNFTLWFHTVRKRRDLDPSSGIKFDNIFVADTHKAWSNKNYWHDKYVNELYISVIYTGKAITISNVQDILDSISYSKQRKIHEQGLKEANTELTHVVGNMLATLKEYGAKRLNILEDREGAYSETLQFFDKIIHMRERRIAVPIMDLSKYLATHKIAFGNNTFEVRDRNKKFFGAILSIKEYHEVSATNLDLLLQLPLEFVITQCIEFANSKEILRQFEYADYILKLSGDTKMREYSGLSAIFDSDTGWPTDYGYHQLTVTIIAEDIKKLEIGVRRAAKELSKLGIVTIREDLNLEASFWSQLPANFSYIRRKLPINTIAMGGFASLHNFPAGKLTNIWGKAVTLFRTALGTPYFFNFHYEASGHTCIIGPHSSGKTTLTNFILTESYKYSPRILVIDHHYRSNLLLKAVGGSYQEISYETDKHGFSLNPLALPDNEDNRLFLQKWFAYLLFNDAAYEISDEEKAAIKTAVSRLYELPSEQRQLSLCVTKLFQNEEHKETSARLLEKIAIWHGEGKYALLFDNRQDDFNNDHKILGLNISHFVEEKSSILPVISYLLYRFMTLLDGHPAIVVINDAWTVLNNKIWKKELAQWLDDLTERNAIAMIGFEASKYKQEEDYICNVLMQNIDTKIFLPNEQVDIYKEAFSLADKEIELVKAMKVINHHFLLKQGPEAIVAELNLTGLDHIIAILAGGDKATKIANEIMVNQGDKPDVWLPVFYDSIR